MWGIDNSQEWKWQGVCSAESTRPFYRMAASNGENRRGPQWSHEYRTAAAIRHVTLYSVLHLLSVVVILALHVALVATRVALAPSPL